MKQISEKHLVLIAAFFAFLVGAYSIYSVINLYAQTTSTNDGATATTVPADSAISGDDDGSSTEKLSTEPEPEPEPEPDPTTTTSDDDGTVTATTASDADNDSSSTEQTASTTNASDSDGDSNEDDSAAAGTDSSSGSGTANNSTTTANTSAGTIEPKLTISVNTEEYIKKFVPRAEAEAVFAKDSQALNEQEREMVKKFKREAVLDSDGDGLPDYEEYRLGTDIFSDDTDQDGFRDGDELKNGFDPKKFSAGDKSDKISYQDPEIIPQISPVYRITKAQIRVKEGMREGQDQVELAGTALPNGIVTLYVYSDPLVVTVQADNDGNWYYVLHHELDEGEHKVYAAVTDSTGKVSARSEAMTFVKTAKALDQAAMEASELQTQMVSPVKKAQANMTKFGLAIAIVSVLLAIASVGYFLVHRSKGPKPPVGGGDVEAPNSNQNQDPTQQS